MATARARASSTEELRWHVVEMHRWADFYWRRAEEATRVALTVYPLARAATRATEWRRVSGGRAPAAR